MGPLARLIVGYASGNATIRQHVDALLKAGGFPASVLFSTIGRTAARCVETLIIADAMVGWLDELQRNTAQAISTRGPASTSTASPRTPKATACPRRRAARSRHWVRIKDGRIDNYQVVVPTTWNAAPRDGKGTARSVRGGAGRGEAREAR